MLVAKVCPVVIRGTEGAEEILAFVHPLAGLQLVKGTLEAGETIEEGAVRELFEESGVKGEPGLELASSDGIASGQEWFFIRVEVGDLPHNWDHHTLDDGGHVFRFFWHPLAAEPDARWHESFVRALHHIRVCLSMAEGR